MWKRSLNVQHKSKGLPWWISGKESACSAGDMGLIPGLGRSPGEGKWQPTPVFLPGKSQGQRSLVGCSPWGFKSPTQFSYKTTTKKYLFICLTAPTLSCSTRSLLLVGFELFEQHVGSSSLTRIEPGPLAWRVRNHSHWITREVPDILCLWN